MEIWGKILEVFCWAWSSRCRAESVFRVGDSRDLPQPRVATSKHATALCSSPFNFSLQGLTGTSTFLSSFFPFHPSLAHSLSIFLSVCLSFLSFCLYVLVFLFLLTYGYFQIVLDIARFGIRASFMYMKNYKKIWFNQNFSDNDMYTCSLCHFEILYDKLSNLLGLKNVEQG